MPKERVPVNLPLRTAAQKARVDVHAQTVAGYARGLAQEQRLGDSDGHSEAERYADAADAIVHRLRNPALDERQLIRAIADLVTIEHQVLGVAAAASQDAQRQTENGSLVQTAAHRFLSQDGSDAVRQTRAAALYAQEVALFARTSKRKIDGDRSIPPDSRRVSREGLESIAVRADEWVRDLRRNSVHRQTASARHDFFASFEMALRGLRDEITRLLH